MLVDFTVRCFRSRVRMTCGHLEHVLMKYRKGRSMVVAVVPTGAYRQQPCPACRGHETAVAQGRLLIEESRIGAERLAPRADPARHAANGARTVVRAGRRLALPA